MSKPVIATLVALLALTLGVSVLALRGAGILGDAASSVAILSLIVIGTAFSISRSVTSRGGRQSDRS